MKKQVVDAVAEEVIQTKTEVSEVVEQSTENIIDDDVDDTDDVESDGDVESDDDVDDTDDVFNDEDDDEVSIFDDDDDEDESSKEDIIRKLLADKKHCKQYKNLTVRNVVYGVDAEGYSFFTFVVKEKIKGRVSVETADGTIVNTIGNSHNVIIGGYSLASVMKDSPRTAIFASKIFGDEDFANELFAGTKINVIAHYIPANTKYVNPFASKQKEVVFNQDKMLYYLVDITLGDVGMDIYREHIRK